MIGRDSLTPSQFADEFFPDFPWVAERFLKTLALDLIVDCTRVHPDDLLFEDLGLGQFDCLAPGHFAADIEEEFGVDILTFIYQDSRKIDDVVRYISANSSRPESAG